MGRTIIARKRGWGLGAVLLIGSLSQTLQADSSGFWARLECVVEKTYVFCKVPVAAAPGSRLTYAEVNLLQHPPFLRAVATKSSFSEDKALVPKLKLGFVVTGAGTGEIIADARGILCKEDGSGCPGASRTLKAIITVSR